MSNYNNDVNDALVGVEKADMSMVVSPYRQARNVYNRATNYGYGLENNFNSWDIPQHRGQFDLFEDNLLPPHFDEPQQLVDIFTVFQQLADKGYGKAYFPLASMYDGEQDINKNTERKIMMRFQLVNLCGLCRCFSIYFIVIKLINSFLCSRASVPIFGRWLVGFHQGIKMGSSSTNFKHSSNERS